MNNRTDILNPSYQKGQNFLNKVEVRIHFHFGKNQDLKCVSRLYNEM